MRSNLGEKVQHLKKNDDRNLLWTAEQLEKVKEKDAV